jgi:hypothetical protein
VLSWPIQKAFDLSPQAGNFTHEGLTTTTKKSCLKKTMT